MVERLYFTCILALCWWPLETSSFLAQQQSRKQQALFLANQRSGTGIDRKSLVGLSSSTSITQARRILNKSLGENGRLFGSVSIPPGASTRGLSDADLAIQTRLANKRYKIMDLIDLSGNKDADRASLSILTVFVSSSIAAVVANQNLPGPEIVRFIVVWLLVFAPLGVVGYGMKDAESLQGILVQLQRQLFPTYRKRMLQHEAGHFLIAHLLGLPIQDYQANAVKNAVSFYPLADSDRGKDFARRLGFDRPRQSQQGSDDGDLDVTQSRELDRDYFSKEGRGSVLCERQSVFRNNATTFAEKIPPLNDPSKVWPYRGFDERTLDELAVISVAGVCAEILAFGSAEGGAADFNQLAELFRCAESEVSEREADNRIRFALGYTMSQLRLHIAVLDALAATMESSGSVADCVIAMESCTELAGPPGYERLRRRGFASEGLLERFVLGDKSDFSLWEDRLNSDKPKLALSGDDPVYLAIGIAFAFFLWASTGGLSLH